MDPVTWNRALVRSRAEEMKVADGYNVKFLKQGDGNFRFGYLVNLR